ncbi:poly(A) polymerase [Nitrosomonas communis]|uniref:Poly(A) polymerase I n=2 Tax=Nitrosomonas communis TaxID=44574 RepID=A0A1I4KZS4_9PROT|nr:poly(A) polymerase [Nitrosomonas communis]
MRNSSTANTVPVLRTILRKEHCISRNQISPGALKVTGVLQQAGFSAFVVGGAIRDLLLGLEPKDFDVATNATPEEVRALFRRSRIIGRRFRLVHVTYGSEIVEVSTFRANYPINGSSMEINAESHADQHGRLLQDNIFGSQEEDVMRRDFTVNALFYNPATEEILDYLSGYEDIEAKRLRIIGEPTQRYREDPVRMLRAVRLAAKLDIQLDEATAVPIGDLAPLLQNVPAARLFDEMLKLLMSGHSLACVLDLRMRGLHHGLLPMLDVILEQPLGERFITLALENTDKRVQEGKPISPGFLFATLLWHEVLAAWNKRQANGEKPMPALHLAMAEILTLQRQQLAIPRRLDSIIYDIWTLQPRFLLRAGHKPFRLLEHPRFRAAYDFLMLRCESGEIDMEVGQWWKTFQHADTATREAMLLKETTPKRRKRNRRRKSAGTTDHRKVTSPI